MAKRIVEYFESDFVDGVTFDNEKEMKSFDSLINDKNYYLECCKKSIENYYDYLCDNKEYILDDIVLDNGKITINASVFATLSEYIIKNITYDLHNTDFSDLVDNIITDDIRECIGEYVIDKIIEFADDINKLVQIELKLS